MSTDNQYAPPRHLVPLGIWGRLLSHPANISFAIVLLSVILLQIPQEWYGRLWGVGRIEFGAVEAALLCLVYGVFLSAWWLASQAAHAGPRREAEPIDFDQASYAWLIAVTGAGLIGVAYTVLLLVSRLGLSGIADAFANSQVNELKFALYDDYSVGLSSLRYCPIIAAPAAALAVIRLGVRTPTMLVILTIAVVSLLINSVISHRLSVVAGLIVYAILHFRSGGRIAWRAIVIAGAAVTVLLAALNSSRNANFYTGIGIDNPLIAALAEAITYVATPAQGALAAMASLLTGDFHHPTGISTELTTNSSLLEALGQYGYPGLFIALATTTFWAFVYVKAFFSKRLELICGAGVIGYAFAEFWRVFLFQYGIFFVLVAFSLGMGFAVRLAWNSINGRDRRVSAPPLARQRPQPPRQPSAS